MKLALGVAPSSSHNDEKHPPRSIPSREPSAPRAMVSLTQSRSAHEGRFWVTPRVGDHGTKEEPTDPQNNRDRDESECRCRPHPATVSMNAAIRSVGTQGGQAHEDALPGVPPNGLDEPSDPDEERDEPAEQNEWPPK
jgi:hypothetical protein